MHITEQVPEKLGSTVAGAGRGANASGLRASTRAKTTFSMYPTFADEEETFGDHHVIVGIESHVCVVQTVLDLLTRDKKSFVRRRRVEHTVGGQSGGVATNGEGGGDFDVHGERGV